MFSHQGMYWRSQHIVHILNLGVNISAIKLGDIQSSMFDSECASSVVGRGVRPASRSALSETTLLWLFIEKIVPWISLNLLTCGST